MNHSSVFALRYPIALLALSLFGCQAQPDFDTLRAEILALHEAAIAAHLNGDVDFFTQNLADDYTVVSGAEVFMPSEEQIVAQFSRYLGRTTFSEYRDLREPIIGFSEDGSVAWIIVQVEVAGTQTDSTGVEQPLHFKSAWLSLYRREGDEWIFQANVSNVVPE